MGNGIVGSTHHSIALMMQDQPNPHPRVVTLKVNQPTACSSSSLEMLGSRRHSTQHSARLSQSALYCRLPSTSFLLMVGSTAIWHNPETEVYLTLPLVILVGWGCEL